MRASLRLLLALTALGGSTSCLNLDDVTTVKDLRVLSVQADKPGFLVNLDDPGSAAAADLTANLTALVVDPRAPGGLVVVSAVGCPDLLDAITAATGQGTKLCAPGMDGTVTIAQADPAPAPPANTPDAAPDIEYHPALVPFGLTPDEVSLLFTPMPSASPTVAQAIEYNRDFGIDAIVNLTFTLGTETASAVKRVIYWPDLSAQYPEVPNQNPLIDHIEFYRSRDTVTGDPTNMWAGTPTVSISAKDKLYVLPVPAADAIETYPLVSKNTQTMQIQTNEVQELLVFDFFATAGTFSPAERRDQVPIFADPGATIHLDSQYNLPSAADLAKLAPSGTVDIWIVVHDERGGESWAHGAISVAP